MVIIINQSEILAEKINEKQKWNISFWFNQQIKEYNEFSLSLSLSQISVELIYFAKKN